MKITRIGSEKNLHTKIDVLDIGLPIVSNPFTFLKEKVE